eukprot:9438100-Alexandrium_andersonii.AAC.2
MAREIRTPAWTYIFWIRNTGLSIQHKARLGLTPHCTRAPTPSSTTWHCMRRVTCLPTCPAAQPQLSDCVGPSTRTPTHTKVMAASTPNNPKRTFADRMLGAPMSS